MVVMLEEDKRRGGRGVKLSAATSEREALTFA